MSLKVFHYQYLSLDVHIFQKGKQMLTSHKSSLLHALHFHHAFSHNAYQVLTLGQPIC